MVADSKTKKFAVMGHPIRHSKSPMIHRDFADQFGLDINYETIDVEPGTFAQTVRDFQASGASGCNVTVPYKIDAFEIADVRSERAQRAGAANTLIFDDQDRICADNTDGVGLLRDITHNLQVPLENKRILILGAGGAVRGIVPSLLSKQPMLLVIANRTAARAREIAARFEDEGTILAGGYEVVSGAGFDVIINATAASMEGEIPPIPERCLTSKTLAYDLMYSDKPTPFMLWARMQGASKVTDGLGMLVEQAAESFYLWHGRRPETLSVMTTLRPSL